MLNEIINELGDNYNSNDESVLNEILEEVTANALTISNRQDNVNNRTLLSREIKTCVKGLYLQRGAEGLTSLSERGTSSSFNDCMEW
jgi:hypothetical protein